MGRGALAASGDAAEVLDFLRGRLSVPRKMLKRVSTARGAGDAQGLRREFIDRMAAASAASLHRTVALLQPFCPPETLARYQRSSWWIDRAAIARHPDCPAPVLKALSADASPVVRAAVSAWKPPTGDEVAHMLADVPEPASDWRKAFEEELGSSSSAVGKPESGVKRSHLSWLIMIWRLECTGRAQLVNESDRLMLRRITFRDHWMRVKLAGNPATPVVVLEALAKDEDSDVRRAVAGNPSTPVKLLEEIAKAKDEWVRRALANNRATPVSVLVRLARGYTVDANDDVAIYAYHNLISSGARLDAFAASGSGAVRRAVAMSDATSVAVLEQLAKDKNSDVRSAVAGNPATPVALLEQLVKDENKSVRECVAGNSATPVTLLEQLVKDENKSVRACVAKNSATPVTLLEQLAKDEDSTVRSWVASNATTPAALMEQLAKDKNSNVRSCVASNATTPAALLEQLAKDGDRNVRWRIARNSSAPFAALEGLAKNDNIGVRSLIAEKSATPVALLEQFAKDENRYVRQAVVENPATPVALLEQFAKDDDRTVRLAVVDNPATPVALLEQLAKDAHSDVRKSVARNPSAPIALLEQLAKDEDSGVRQAAAGNPSTPANILRALAVDYFSGVRAAVAGNPAVPADVLEALLLDPGGNLDLAPGALEDEASLKQLRAELLAGILSGKKPSRERAYGLLQPDCPVPVLTRCARSSLWLERCAIAQNPGTPEKVLRQLAVDPVPAVRAAAQERLASGRA
jgi:hypothetical protein